MIGGHSAGVACNNPVSISMGQSGAQLKIVFSFLNQDIMLWVLKVIVSVRRFLLSTQNKRLNSWIRN